MKIKPVNIKQPERKTHPRVVGEAVNQGATHGGGRDPEAAGGAALEGVQAGVQSLLEGPGCHHAAHLSPHSNSLLLGRLAQAPIRFHAFTDVCGNLDHLGWCPDWFANAFPQCDHERQQVPALFLVAGQDLD